MVLTIWGSSTLRNLNTINGEKREHLLDVISGNIVLNILTGLSCSKMEDFPGSYSNILLGSARYFLVSTFLSGGPHSFLAQQNTDTSPWHKWCSGVLLIKLFPFTVTITHEGNITNHFFFCCLTYMSGKSFSRSLSLALSWRRDGIGGGGGGGPGEGDGSRRLPWSEWLLASGL